MRPTVSIYVYGKCGWLWIFFFFFSKKKHVVGKNAMSWISNLTTPSPPFPMQKKSRKRGLNWKGSRKKNSNAVRFVKDGFLFYNNEMFCLHSDNILKLSWMIPPQSRHLIQGMSENWLILLFFHSFLILSLGERRWRVFSWFLLSWRCLNFVSSFSGLCHSDSTVNEVVLQLSMLFKGIKALGIPVWCLMVFTNDIKLLSSGNVEGTDPIILSNLYCF